MKKNIWNISIITAYIIFISVSLIFKFEPGKKVGINFIMFLKEMLMVLPCAFVLIGLFEVWVKRETIEKHLGKESGIMSYIWVILLAGTTIGGVYVALPVAQALYGKGAKLSVIFTYVGSAAICRIPMIIFEASFLGMDFSIIRLLVSLPLIIITSMVLEKYLIKTGYKMNL